MKDAHARSVGEVLDALGVDPDGLSDEEVRRRRKRHGANRLAEARTRGPLRVLVDQFKSVVLVILMVAAVLAFSTAQWAEGVAIVAVLLVNGAIGFVTEWRALQSMEALRRSGPTHARVRRGGSEQRVEAWQIVPGDVLLLDAGDVAPADGRLVEANNLRIKEASLTGESESVDKTLGPVDADAPLAERRDMVFKGTTLVEGSAEVVVTATGMDTQIGHIARMTEEAEEERTPLERRLESLGRRLAVFTLATAAVVAGAGLLSGKETLLMIETAIALGVAAIPEGMPIVATIALARGMWIMARRQALINKLTAVETLGATSLIFTDKTGTLTENRMTLDRIVTEGGETSVAVGDGAGGLARRALEAGVLCTNARIEDRDADDEPDVHLGDPTEVALLAAGWNAGLRYEELVERMPEVREESFDPEVMMMATFHELDDGVRVAVKGAPSAVLEHCTRVAADGGSDEELDGERRRRWLERAERMASEGLRVLAAADKVVADPRTEPYEELVLVGLLGLIDPPREGVEEALTMCRDAHIRVNMVTGDQPATARAIAGQVGLVEDGEDAVLSGRDLVEVGEASEEQRREILSTRVFARVSPAQKLELMTLFQDEGETTAMTGDGVNDAPALKKADIGVAMGQRGTDAARQAADMVLKDDAFSSIVAAVEQGRIIFTNIRRSIMFMLCTNVAEIIAVGTASLADIPLPLRPLQILYLNVITDVFPALALAVGRGSGDVMQRAPRRESILTWRHWIAIGGWGLAIAACVLAALLVGERVLGGPVELSVTLSFLTLAFAKLWFVFNLRDARSGVIANDVVQNGWIWGALGLCALLLAAAVYLPGLGGLLSTTDPGPKGWGILLALSLVPLVLGQSILAIRGRLHDDGA
jgi:Ca2+-transporting ATPase